MLSLSVVSSKKPRPLLCIYLTLCLHKAAQLEKDFPLFVLPCLWRPKGRQQAIGFIWPSHAGSTGIATISESSNTFTLFPLKSCLLLDYIGVIQRVYSMKAMLFRIHAFYYHNLICVFITFKDLRALGADEILEPLCKFS